MSWTRNNAPPASTPPTTNFPQKTGNYCPNYWTTHKSETHFDVKKEECQNLCQANDKCGAYQYRPGTPPSLGSCYLGTSLYESDGCMYRDSYSSVPVAPPPPPPPTPAPKTCKQSQDCSHTDCVGIEDEHCCCDPQSRTCMLQTTSCTPAIPIPKSDITTSCTGGDKCDSTKARWCVSQDSGDVYQCLKKKNSTQLTDVDCIGNKDKTTLFDGKTQSVCEQLCKQDSTCTFYSWKGSGDVGECRTRSGDPPDFKWGGCGETVWGRVKEEYWEKFEPLTCEPYYPGWHTYECHVGPHQLCKFEQELDTQWWSCTDHSIPDVDLWQKEFWLSYFSNHKG